MKLLVIGHSLVIGANRKFWSTFARHNHGSVDMVVPSQWSSNLTKEINYSPYPQCDTHIRKIFPLKVVNRGNGSFFFFQPLALWKILVKEKYDAIYLNQETWALSTLEVILLKLISFNIKTKVYLCVAQNIRKEHLKFLHPYERFIARFIHTFFYCSEGVKDVLRWKGIMNPCSYLPLPYDDEVYEASLSQETSFFKLGYLGRLTDDKGLLILLRALDELDQTGFKFKFIIGGNGPLLETIKKKNYVDYLGIIPHDKAHEFYQKIDCFILPSQTKSHWKEQFGRVIVESFGSGRPVIGSDSGSIPEVLSMLRWPWVFREDSWEELKDMIINLQQHLQTEQGQRELQQAVTLNKQLFSQQEVAEGLFKHFQSNA